jgi:hypothetical protein
MTDTYSDVHQSFNRCLQRRDFLSRFYTIFVSSHPDIAAKFADTQTPPQEPRQKGLSDRTLDV